MRILSTVITTLVGVVVCSAAAGAQRQPTRLSGLDRDGDGVITRAEWRGNDRSFEVHDWNGDGVLSGDEVEPSGRRAGWSNDQGGELNDWTEARFRDLDRNDDRRITRNEWTYSAAGFSRADHNNDGVITLSEFLGDSGYGPHYGDGRPGDTFDGLDTNRDGRVSRNEWRCGEVAFRAIDRDGDGFLSSAELGPGGTNNSAAYRQGYDRGLQDGRKAGSEDRARNAWDLDGQRELEQADAGYSSRMGSRRDYQDGYTEGFVLGYGQGYGRR
jgi:EF hand